MSLIIPSNKCTYCFVLCIFLLKPNTENNFVMLITDNEWKKWYHKCEKWKWKLVADCLSVCWIFVSSSLTHSHNKRMFSGRGDDFHRILIFVQRLSALNYHIFFLLFYYVKFRNKSTSKTRIKPVFVFILWDHKLWE